LTSGGQGAKPARSPNDITHAIITAALKVHSALGPGLLESAYEACLIYELQKGGFSVTSQVPMPLVYDGIKLDIGYRLDILVEDAVIVEVKAVDAISNIHHAQILSYLKLSQKSLGLILNFNVLHLREGIKRVVNGADWKKSL
jgi:GxxExxY protein